MGWDPALRKPTLPTPSWKTGEVPGWQQPHHGCPGYGWEDEDHLWSYQGETGWNIPGHKHRGTAQLPRGFGVTFWQTSIDFHYLTPWGEKTKTDLVHFLQVGALMWLNVLVGVSKASRKGVCLTIAQKWKDYIYSQQACDIRWLSESQTSGNLQFTKFDWKQIIPKRGKTVATWYACIYWFKMLNLLRFRRNVSCQLNLVVMERDLETGPATQR